jgi:hypothetical protein
MLAHMHGWGDQREEDGGKKCQQWVVARDAAGWGEHDGSTFLSLQRHFCLSCHSRSSKITSADAKIAWFNLTP